MKQLMDALETVRQKKKALEEASAVMRKVMADQQALVTQAQSSYEKAVEEASAHHKEFSDLVASLLPTASRQRTA